jgi:hypothetical protein
MGDRSTKTISPEAIRVLAFVCYSTVSMFSALKSKAYLDPIQLDIPMRNELQRLVDTVRKAAPENENVHAPLDLAQYQTPYGS